MLLLRDTLALVLTDWEVSVEVLRDDDSVEYPDVDVDVLDERKALVESLREDDKPTVSD